jgi:hypothetical protein
LAKILNRILNVASGDSGVQHSRAATLLMAPTGPADTSRMESPSKLAPASPLPDGGARTAPAGRRLRVAAAIALALAVGIGAWLILRDEGAPSAPSGDPVSHAVSLSQLRALPAETGHPVYWAGQIAGHAYELTRPTDGNVYIRYLPPGTRVGDRQPVYTAIGTYPRPRALRELRRLSRRSGTVSFPLGGGGIAVYSRDRPSSVYLAFPRVDVQVEVYDPSPRRALRLARSGRVRPVG